MVYVVVLKISNIFLYVSIEQKKCLLKRSRENSGRLHQGVIETYLFIFVKISVKLWNISEVKYLAKKMK